MANFTISPNMNLVVPTPGEDPGPDYATHNSQSLNIIDGHNHSPGSGVLINTNGLSINADLPINQFNVTAVKTINFTSQGTTIPGTAPNLGCIYVAGNELVYNDEAGNVVPITNSGSVNAGAGSITGLPSGTASASYSSGSQTFVWQSATLTPANMDFASAILRNLTASSKGLTLNPPAAMAADFALNLPSLPASTLLLTLDTSGNIATVSNQSIADTLGQAMTSVGANAVANTRTRSTGTTVGAGGYALSNSCGTFLTTSSTPVDVTNLSVTITTTGRPVAIGIIADASTGSSVIAISNNSSAIGGPTGDVFLLTGSTVLVSSRIRITVNSPTPVFSAIQIPVSTVSYIDYPATGTYTYKVQLQADAAGSSATINDAKLYAYEL